MPRSNRLLALLLLALWLPATLHCDLERAAVHVHVLTHEHHDHSSACHGNGPDSFCHAIEDVAFTASAPSLKISLPADSLSVVLASLVRYLAEAVEPALSVPRHDPPLALTVVWQFVRRAAPLARAPELNA